MKTLLVLLVRGYRLAISPLFPPRCRFLPSCSDYALQAIERHGALAGGWLALRRFVRCSPLTAGGIDEVPETPGGWFAGNGAVATAGQWSGLRRIGCRCRRPTAQGRSSSQSASSSQPADSSASR